jgi:hypothetical protein
MVSAILGGACENAHATPGGDLLRSQGAVSHLDQGHQCPCCPVEGEADTHGCDCSCDCACHASLAAQPYSYCYTPVSSDLRTSEPFAYLPEVFLSKFIPPQLQA